jgi:peptidoglycan LD-endopeptidase CwlK
MSAPLFTDDILFLQRFLAGHGFYLGALDGIWGKQTEKAARTFDEKSFAIRGQHGAFDPRTEGHILSLSLNTQIAARVFMGRVLAAGMRVKIISGTRSYAQQDALYRQGRNGNTQQKVTNARGGSSNHNFGIAWDIGIFTATSGYLGDSPEYARAARIGAPDGTTPAIEWGGNWVSFQDKPHYQLDIGIGVAELRRMFEAGERIAGY